MIFVELSLYFISILVIFQNWLIRWQRHEKIPWEYSKNLSEFWLLIEISQTQLSLIRILTRSNKLHAWKNMHAYCLPTNNLHTYVYSIYILKICMLLIFLWLWSQSSTCSRFSCHQKLKNPSHSAPLLGTFLFLAVSFWFYCRTTLVRKLKIKTCQNCELFWTIFLS